MIQFYKSNIKAFYETKPEDFNKTILLSNTARPDQRYSNALALAMSGYVQWKSCSWARIKNLAGTKFKLIARGRNERSDGNWWDVCICLINNIVRESIVN